LCIDGFNTYLKSVARTARLKGFRPGKAPLPVVRQQFGAQVQSEVVGDLLRETYSDAVNQQSLRPATDPRIELVAADPGADLRYVASFEVLPEILLAPVTDIAIERPTASIAESDIAAMLESMRRQRPDFVAVERGAGDTDRVTVDFEGRIDGVTFQGGTGTDVPFVVGQGRMLKEFEDGVRGAKAGDSRTVTVNFPADYGSPDVAGKTAQFAVTVKSVEEQKLPEIDEEFCLAFGVTEGGVEALREAVVSSMESELSKAIRSRLRTQVLDALYAANPIDVPKSMIAEQVQTMQVDFARRMGLRDLSQLPQTDAMEEPARRRVATGLIVSELLRAENIKLDREFVNARLNEVTGEGPGSDDLRRQYLQSVEAMRQIESLALEDQLVDFVVARAKVTDKPATFSELTGFGQNAPA
jgi:trigger factor